MGLKYKLIVIKAIKNWKKSAIIVRGAKIENQTPERHSKEELI